MTVDEIAAHFAEAARVLRMIPCTDRDRPAGYRSITPTALRDDQDSWTKAIERLKELRGVLKPEETALIADKPPPVRLTPSLEQIALLNECLIWNWYLLPEERIAVWGVAQNASGRKICKQLMKSMHWKRCSRDKVDRLRRDGLKRVAFVLAEQSFNSTSRQNAA